MGKPRDAKVAILPSTTRKGTTLSTSAALDSPSVISQLVSPPQASHAGTSAESENSSYNFNDASTVLDDNGSLGPFLDATIARSRQIENTEIPNENTVTPVNSPESVEHSSDDFDEYYVELDDDFIDKCNATTSVSNIKKLLAQRAVRYKLSPDPKFATSPINIKDKDYDFSLDLSHISIVEKTPFCGTEKESAVEHMNELSTLSSLFSDDIKKRTYFVAKIFPFSLKDDAKTWYNSLPPDSIDSPSGLLDVFFRKYFPASAQHIALQKIYSFDQEDREKLPEAWARFCSLLRARPGHDLEKHDLLDIFYSGLTIESRAYLDSCAGCVFRKRTPDEAEELMARISQNHDDWTTPEPTPTPILKKRGMIKLSDEDMREAKKSLKEKDNDKNDASDKEEVEDEPEKHAKNKKYTKEDFIAKKHGNEREPFVQKQMPFPVKKLKSKEEEHYNKFCDWMKPLFLQIPLTDAIKLPPYSKYMKDIVSNKRKIPNEEISTMLANYSFNGKVPKKLGDPGLLDDFLFLINRVGLSTYMEDESDQFYRLTKIFVESFKFSNSAFSPSVKFKIYDMPITMKLKDFCAALDINPIGTAKKIENRPKALTELYREVTNDDDRTIQRGKIRNIQLPAIRYFTYYLATSILGRENTSNICSYHLAFLVAALTGSTPYHLGVLIARRLASKGPIYGGIVASHIVVYLGLPVDPSDEKLTPIKLDIAAMKSHQFVTTNSNLENIVYRMLFIDGDEREIPLPQADLFSVRRRPWSRSKEEVDEQLRILGFHQQHDSEDAEPSDGYTVTYPGASSILYQGQDPPSSYYGGATSWAPWD
ncbi:hypothetical protein QYE76_019117 [Lolium multiflorum]|uniref:Retrotransposon gag domain-containing protein n=1 Tax=Lolium multiflorum TaxID=4521 RepID=A0AAD8R3X5_LOLMU|nr:hypothetical protein QYE76_019117 [Lolium multiflorum]